MLRCNYYQRTKNDSGQRVRFPYEDAVTVHIQLIVVKPVPLSRERRFQTQFCGQDTMSCLSNIRTTASLRHINVMWVTPREDLVFGVRLERFSTQMLCRKSFRPYAVFQFNFGRTLRKHFEKSKHSRWIFADSKKWWEAGRRVSFA